LAPSRGKEKPAPRASSCSSGRGICYSTAKDSQALRMSAGGLIRRKKSKRTNPCAHRLRTSGQLCCREKKSYPAQGNRHCGVFCGPRSATTLCPTKKATIAVYLGISLTTRDNPQHPGRLAPWTDSGITACLTKCAAGNSDLTADFDSGPSGPALAGIQHGLWP